MRGFHWLCGSGGQGEKAAGEESTSRSTKKNSFNQVLPIGYRSPSQKSNLSRRRSSLAAANMQFSVLQSKIDVKTLEFWQRVFNHFDVSNTGFIKYHQIANCLRYIGFNPTELQVQEFCDNEIATKRNGSQRNMSIVMGIRRGIARVKSLTGVNGIHNLNRKVTTRINFEEFSRIAHSVMEDEKEMSDILYLAFKFLDVNDDGVISKEEFSNVMSTVGEVLNEAQIDEVYRIFDKEGQGLSYEAFINLIINDKEDFRVTLSRADLTFEGLEESQEFSLASLRKLSEMDSNPSVT